MRILANISFLRPVQNVRLLRLNTSQFVPFSSRTFTTNTSIKLQSNKQTNWFPPVAAFAMDSSKEQLIIRERMNKNISSRVEKLQLPENCRLSSADILWANKDLCFVGVGLESNFPGVRYGIANDIFKSRRVAVVRDVFERDEKHSNLQTIMALSSDNEIALVYGAQKPPLHRLVNEYTRTSLDDSQYSLTRHDVGLAEYISNGGFRKVIVDSTTQLSSDALETIKPRQSTNRVLMVSPTAFEPNVEAALDNHFMAESTAETAAKIKSTVLKEYAGLHAEIAAAGIDCHLFTHEPFHDTPDALFPNNWFSTHTAKEMNDEPTLVLYPMKVPNRRKERRSDFLKRIHFQRYTKVLDISTQEIASTPEFLEGTGSLVLDRVNKVAYLAISERSNLNLAKIWAENLGYKLVAFTSVDRDGRVVYHTNVVMCVGTSVAIICAEGIRDPAEREMVLNQLKETGHEVLEITQHQVDNFCGNTLELENLYGERVLAMSTAAYEAFGEEGRKLLEKHFVKLLHAPIPTIEKYGGGGVRCSIAELF